MKNAQLTDLLTDLMDQQHRRIYAERRLLHQRPDKREEQIRDITKAIIHNGFMSPEVETVLRRGGLEYEKYLPPESNEPHYFVRKTGHLHMVNSRDPVRLERNADLVYVLSEITGRQIELQIEHYQNNPSKADLRFLEFAHALVEEVLQNIPEGEIQKQGYLNTVIGPFECFDFGDSDVIASRDNDYLNWKVIRASKRWTVSLDYIFACQAEFILGGLFSKISALAPGAGVRIFHYGKHGALNSSEYAKIEIGDIGIPIGYLDQRKLSDRGHQEIDIIHNALKDRDARETFEEVVQLPVHYTNTVNTRPVLRQQRSELECALRAGGRLLDMEWALMSKMGECVHSRSPNIGWVDIFLSGTASDLPLEGRTLAYADYEKIGTGLKAVTEAYKEIIRRYEIRH